MASNVPYSNEELVVFFTNMQNQSRVQVNWRTGAASAETEASALVDDENSAVYLAMLLRAVKTLTEVLMKCSLKMYGRINAYGTLTAGVSKIPR